MISPLLSSGDYVRGIMSTDPNPSTQTAPAPVARDRPWLVPVAAGFGGALFGAIATLVIVGGFNAAATSTADAAASTLFADAVEECGADGPDAVIGDEGKSLTIDMKGEDDTVGMDGVDVWCVVSELDTPQSAQSHMEQTTSMDGRQTETWDNIEVSWSYHPDRGMDSVWKIVDAD